jgi:hypothetical protein
MSNTRSDRLRQIIDRRRSLIDGIQASETQVLDLKEKLNALEGYRHQLLSDIQNRSDSASAQDRLKKLNFFDSILQIDTLLGVFENLKHRFDRQTLNIGVVGQMRQGKSTLLQRLSGLTDAEIPAQKGGACTAVRSIVYHHDGDTRVDVTFHSEKSLLEEVIQQYWRSLELPDCPDSLDSFERNTLPEPKTAVGQAMYKNLLEYKEYLGKYRPLLAVNRPSRESISVDKIGKYVTHQRDEQDRLVSYEFLAIKQVEIYCRFAQSDLGQLALIDVPGLGDTKLGDEALLLNTLGREVDLILFVRRPDSYGDQWKKKEDIGLYDTANKQLNQLSERAFMVLNHVSKSDNLEDCQRFERTMSGMKVVDTFIVDCYESEEVNHRILEPIINYAIESDRLFELDRSHRDSILIPSCDRLYAEVKSQLTLAHKVFGELQEDEAWAEKVEAIFDNLWENLRLGMQERLEEIATRRGQEDPSLQKQIQETFRSCREETEIPSLEKIRKELLAHKREPYTLYERYMNEMRLRLSQKFISMDVGLKDSLDIVKKEIGDVLSSSGRLAALAPDRGIEFCEDITAQIPEDLGELKKVFSTFSGFNLLYRGMIQHRIRPLLDGITPGSKDYPSLSKSPTADEMSEVLERMYQETVYKCEQALQGLLHEPSEAVFAIAEEFVDGLLWSKDIKRQYKFFVQRNRSKIWVEEFKPNEGKLEWKKLVDAAMNANQPQKINRN